MNRGVILLLLGFGVLTAGPWASGQVYSGEVLYPLTAPSGFQSVYPLASPQTASGGQTVGFGFGMTVGEQALVWNSAGTAVNLNPSGFAASYAYGTNGAQQVGSAEIGNNPEAFLWNGTAASAVNLNPTGLAGITASTAWGTSGTQQVGEGYGTGTGGNEVGLLWTGTAASAVNLNPSGFTTSVAFATSGTQQVGSGSGTATGGNANALLWTGTAVSAVNLNPTVLSGVTLSYALGAGGTEQVGYGSGVGTAYQNHALLWTGTASSAVDLNPTNLSGFEESFAEGTNGTVQVGEGSASFYGEPQALLWTGTAGSAVDLQTQLPSTGTWMASTAYTVNSLGDVFGTAQGTLNGVNGTYAVEWVPTTMWATAVSGNWASGPSWTPQTVPSGTLGADFGTGSANSYTVTLTGSSTANAIDVGGDKVTIQKAGFSLTVPGAVTIAGRVGHNALLLLSGAGADTFNSLSISNGQLDITDNTVVINYGVANPSPVSAIGAYIKSGYNGDAWNGVGIMSSKVASVNAAKANPHLYGIGYANASDAAVANDHFAAGTVVIEPAIVGDANLDGVVNYTDFQLLSANFNSVGTSWDQGNFNYGSGTNYIDFQLLAANFNDSTSLDSAELDSMNQFAGQFGESLVANSDGMGFTIVPEPAGVAMIFVAGLAMLGRRKSAMGVRLGGSRPEPDRGLPNLAADWWGRWQNP